MVKPTKRQRKFNATGGIKGRIDKGTITNKGKLRKRKKGETFGAQPNKRVAVEEEPQERTDNFVGESNLGELDMESFFSKAAESVEKKGLEDESDDEGEDDASEDSDDQNEDKKDNAEDGNSSDDSASDDDDVDTAQARMRAEMEKMKSSDPEFHKYLKENEESLLEFGEEDDDDDDDEEPVDDDDDDDEEGAEDKDIGVGKEKKDDAIQLTPKVLKVLEKKVFESHSIKSLKKLIGAYRSACHLADASQEDDKLRPGESGTNYVIDSSKVFDQLMVLCLNRCEEEFRYHLLGSASEESTEDGDTEADDKADLGDAEESKPLNPKTLEKSEKWNEIRPIMLSFFRSTLHVMSEAKEPELVTFILKSLSKYARYMTPFPRIAESMLKTLTGLWSAPLDSSEDYQVVRLNAFFRIRQLALTQPFPFIEDCLKKTYLAYAKRAKFGTAASVTNALPTLTFMGNCLVELYSLDYHSSYQHAFVYIRQLALHLRTAMQKKTKEAFQTVYCWQYIHCLKLWVAVLAAACPNEDSTMLRSLIYPLTEVILGTVRLAPFPTRHLPMRLHCVRLLQQLAAAAEVFIPTTSLLLDCLEWKEWHLKPKKTKGGSARALHLSLILKLPKDDTLRTHEQLEAGMSDVFKLLQREIELYRFSAGFPEYSVRIVQCLRKFNKEVRNPRWRTFAKGCLDTCERYSKYAVQGRSKLLEAPKDVAQLECLKQHSQPSMRERHEVSVEKEQKSLEASRALANPDAGKKSKPTEDMDDEEEEDNEEEDAESNKSKKKKRNKKAKVVARDNTPEPVFASAETLEQEDQVKEGVEWSDEE
jgi:nucleolar complex protein 2